MVGVVVVGHGRLGEEMVRTLESVLGPQAQLAAVATSTSAAPEAIRAEIATAAQAVDRGGGVIICTDMLGDTATNQSLVVAREIGAEVVAGVNMPILVKLCSDREQGDPKHLAGFLLQYGQTHIFWATEPHPHTPHAR